MKKCEGCGVSYLNLDTDIGICKSCEYLECDYVDNFDPKKDLVNPDEDTYSYERKE